MKTRSTYKLLVESEDKRRNLLETVLYAIIALSAIVAIEQFTVQPNPIQASATQTAAARA
jgi:hypothetical protein